MAAAFPYSHVACPCTSLTTGVASTTSSRRTSYQPPLNPSAAELTSSTFNPHDPRANYSLYPYDHLLYCDECHQIRCPRCWTEEIMNWYCPSCLFEVPSSVVKSDGNRCTRNCYNCPSCTAPLSINALGQQSKDHLSPQDAVPSGPFLLSCPHCDWTSLDVGIQLSKPTKITEQLNKLRSQKRSSSPSQSRNSLPSGNQDTDPAALDQTVDGKFAALTTFYKDQLSESANLSNQLLGTNLNSPDNLTRIMNLYGGLSYTALKKSREKPLPMREALTSKEGLALLDLEDEHAGTIEKLRRHGHASTAAPEQRNSHPFNHDVRFSEDLWPIATLLRTRRSKRCRVCRHILTKPEPKIGSTRYKIRLLAQNHIPRLSLRLFSPNNNSNNGGGSSSSLLPSSSSSTPAPTGAFALTSLSLQSSRDSDYERLRPMMPVQFLLTLTNPLFDPVRVTLATPATTPGAVESRVTILCPSFDIGAAGDLWDEALNGNGSTAGAGAGAGAGANPSSTTSQTLRPGSKDSNKDADERQPEAGKVWDKGRNWTAVVMEVVPGSLPMRSRSATTTTAAAAARYGYEDDDEHNGGGGGGGGGGAKDKRVDQDVLEIPVFVRVEWDAEVTAEDAAASGAARGAKESRELAFWTILGAGRIAG